MNSRLVFALIFLVILAVIYVNYQQDVNIIFRNFLEWKHLNTSLWLYIMICYLIYYLSVRGNDNIESGVIFREFGTFGNSAFAAITFGLASTTSASILKGVYIQQFFKDKIYFNEFNEIDIYSMLVVSMFLFGYSVYSSLQSLLKAIMLQRGENVKKG